ncbi:MULTISPECIES: iron-containing alcohol dehydrogenase [unclassified Moorena]|uniref:iron-containing alcohol dehydrogenase n=1 Tax=unclassified Moorena TaxID=2683338 RepID=UPI0013FEBE31|nr:MULTISPECIES: iron-containing alcohol dehydrogenase [unclassified Moorena]NEO17442.1 iron-containing alcohol dehydrogenase [Moorena sp. SIO3E8]NEQ03988.1 iron-containing alcohol dehydrogenase [Moorena sp. SIO3F7]
MDCFDFYNPVKVLFGKGKIAAIANEIPTDARVLMTYGGGSIKKNGVYEQVKAALAKHRVLEFGGITPNPELEILLDAVNLARTEEITYLLAVGGGSVIDATKFIAVAVPFVGDLWDILTANAPLTAALPLGTVLTLPATGSEMNSYFVVTRRSSQEKLQRRSELVFPRFSVLDPTVTFSLPRHQISNGIVDSFTHTLEQYLTYPVNAALQDRMAESILLTLIEEGPKTLAAPTDYDARSNLMWCATIADNELIGAGVPQDWSTHMIAHELTALYGLDHAVTLAIIMPSLLTYKRDTKGAKLLQFARRVWGITQGNDEQRISQAISATRNFFESLGLSTRLRDYGLDSSCISEVIESLDKHDLVPLGERQDITLEDVRQILSLSI